MDDAEIEQRLIEFATEYIKSYTDALNRNFGATVETLKSNNLIRRYLPLCDCTLGVNCSIAAFIASASLQIFFLRDTNTEIRASKIARESPEFNQRWTLETPRRY
jgi:hypothetical protein